MGIMRSRVTPGNHAPRGHGASGDRSVKSRGGRRGRTRSGTRSPQGAVRQAGREDRRKTAL